MMKSTNIAKILISVVLTLSIILGSSCSILTGSGPTLAPTTPATSTPIIAGSIESPSTAPIQPGFTVPVTESQSVLPSIADVVEKAKPSVVAINTQVTTFDFFNRPLTEEGAGSGWIISADGIVVTNNHVIEGAESIKVTLDDGRTFDVAVRDVAADPITDLAVLKIDARNLPALVIGDSRKLRIGDWVVAIGNSLGRGTRATVGIVSQLGVSLDVDGGTVLYNLLETSAAINPGNSGGPLVNLSGEVVGITSAKIIAVGAEATGFAISSQEATPMLEQLIKTGHAVRPWLGVALYTVDQLAIQTYNLAVNQGALITQVTVGSPADKAGLRPGDVITKFGNTDVGSLDDLIQAIRSSQIGQTVTLTIWRGSNEQTVSVTLVASPRL